MVMPPSPSTLPPESQDRTAAVLGLLALTLLCLALMQNFGDLTPLALALVLATLGLVLIGLAKSRGSRWELERRWWVMFVGAAGLTNIFNLRLPQWIGIHWSGQRDVAVVILVVALTIAATAAAALPLRRAAAALAVTALLGLGLIVATWPTWGSAGIDIFRAVTGATSALLHGDNPYGSVFTYVTAIAPSQMGVLKAHFVYGPIVPVLAALGWLVGDVRVMSVVALAATVAGFWVLARQGAQAASAHRVVALAVASPLAVAMVQEAWVEVYIVAGVIGWLALRHRHRHWATAALGMAMLVNPITLVVLVPWFIWSRRARFEVMVAGMAAALFALPFIVVTGVGAFLHDVVGVQLAQQPRYNALTLTSYLWQTWHLVLPGWLPAILVVVTVVLIIGRGPPSHEAELAGLAAVMIFATFLAAKWAFFNYYYIAAMMLLAAMASAGVRFAPGDLALPDPRALLRRSKLRQPG